MPIRVSSYSHVCPNKLEDAGYKSVISHWLGAWRMMNDDFKDIILNFCPFCGEKLEVPDATKG